MIRDPLGGWDWDGIRQLCFSLVMLFALVSAFAALDSKYTWSDPWMVIADFISAYPEYFIVGSMLVVLSIWWINQFDGGYY
tara:strand:- start:650 stop:892 length:243 start_codon:yes stop_codon:yes gene_type:complete